MKLKAGDLIETIDNPNRKYYGIILQVADIFGISYPSRIKIYWLPADIMNKENIIHTNLWPISELETALRDKKGRVRLGWTTNK